jgi:hypothetical protein
VKTFADTSFFLLFEEILRRDKPKENPETWSAAGVTWHHTRHTFEGQSYGFTIEIYEAVCSTKGGWSLIIAKEHWWAGRHGEIIRSAHWAKPLRGKRTTIIAWLKERQRQMDSER